MTESCCAECASTCQCARLINFPRSKIILLAVFLLDRASKLIVNIRARIIYAPDSNETENFGKELIAEGFRRFRCTVFEIVSNFSLRKIIESERGSVKERNGIPYILAKTKKKKKKKTRKKGEKNEKNRKQKRSASTLGRMRERRVIFRISTKSSLFATCHRRFTLWYSHFRQFVFPSWSSMYAQPI